MKQNKLKTLKDLKVFESKREKTVWLNNKTQKFAFKQKQDNCNTVDIEELRQSAQKWLDWWEYCIENIGYAKYIGDCYKSQIDAFKQFFNL